MAEEKNITVVTEEKTEATAPKTENQYLLKLNHPYVFEGKEYAEIDLAGLDKLTVQDAINAQRQLFNEREPAAMLLCETTTAFVRILAAKATGLPIEFFKLAPRGVSRRIYGMVMGYMNVDSNTENHIMRLEKPYYFEGKQYTEVDLNGVADLNSLNESAAENCRNGNGSAGGVLYRAAAVRGAENQKRRERRGFFRVKGGAKALRKAAIRLAAVTRTGVDFYLNLPTREFAKLNDEVAEEWRRAKH